MNVARFVVLGMLDRIGPACGYDIISELEKKMIDRWTNIKKGSIYHALKTLEKGGQIRETERVKKGLFPTMTLYEVTDKGREEFDDMQAEAFLGLFPYYFGFKLALKFNLRRSPAEIMEFAEKAILVIDANIAGRDAYLGTIPETDPRLEQDTFFIEHDKMLLREEKRWIQMAVERIRRNQKRS